MSDRYDRDYDRGYRARFRRTSRLTWFVIVALILGLVCGFSARGLPGTTLPVLRDLPIVDLIPLVECSDLPEPLGSNNRAILSRRASRDSLDIIVSAKKTTFVAGEFIELEVVYYNTDNGPLVIYHNEDIQPPISISEGFSGLMFEIERVGGAALIDQSGHPPAAVPFAQRYLRVLGSRARCTEDYILAGDRLQLAGLTPGSYRIRAVYINQNPGVRPAEELNPPFPQPTLFPEYRADQNVWVGRSTSNEVNITITG